MSGDHIHSPREVEVADDITHMTIGNYVVLPTVLQGYGEREPEYQAHELIYIYYYNMGNPLVRLARVEWQDFGGKYQHVGRIL